MSKQVKPSSHTPRPWEIGLYEQDELAIVKGRQTIALLDQGYFDRPLTNAECEANARLIAAAPEMLEALEHALADLEHLGGRVLKVKAAILKATGGAK